MAMSPPTPHRVSSTRITRTGGETYTAPVAVLSDEPALIAPWSPGEKWQTVMGPADTSKFVLFIGWDADVQLGDEITNDASGEVYVVMEPPSKFDNPNTWEHDHQQIIIRQRPVN